MAYNRVNWQNGTKVSDGYVTIDGTNYSVTQPTYSGATPVNETSLNVMDEGIEENSNMVTGNKTMGKVFVEDIHFKNLFNKNTIIEDTIIDLDGSELTGYTSWCASDYIPVEAGKKYTYQGITNTGDEKYSAYYDSNKQFVDYFEQETGSNNTITIPTGVAYVRFSMLIVNADSFQLEVGEESTEYMEYKEFEGTAIPQQPTAPSNPSENDLWIDTSNNSLKRYNGTEWENVGSAGSNSDNTPVGKVTAYAGTTAPRGYLLCDGSAISRTEYAELFSTIGTFYGSGNGTTTFNIPNIKGRTVVGLDSNDSDFDTLGETGGSKYLQEHTHNNKMDTLDNLDRNYGLSSNGVYADRVVVRSNNSNANTLYNEKNIQDAGTGNSGNLPPYIVLNYIIKAFSIVPTPGNVTGESLPVGSEMDFNGQVSEIPEGWEQIDDPYQYIVATISSQQTASSSYVVNLNKIERKKGDFTLSGGFVKIPAGVKKVRVSGSVFINSWPGDRNYLWGKIFKNTNPVATVVTGSPGSYLSAPIPATVIEVQEGDNIKLMADSGPGGTIRENTDNTWLCVEKVE